MRTRNTILFVINPYAGVKSKKNFKYKVKRVLGNANIKYELVYTKYQGHAKQLAQKAAKNNFDIVAAVGGDGTVNEVAQGLIGTNTAMGIVPGGSGNGLSMHLGIGRNSVKALKYLRNPQIDIIDTCKVNNELCVNMVGLGFEAEVASYIRGVKRRGLLGYLHSTWMVSRTYENEEVTVQLDKSIIKGKFLSVNMANGSMFGYNCKVAPDADLRDGKMNVVLMHNAPKWKYVMHSWRLLNGSIDKAPFVEIIHAKSAKIKASGPITYHLDGNGINSEIDELKVEVLSNSLKIVVPSKRKRISDLIKLSNKLN